MSQNNWIDKLDDKEIQRLSGKKPKYKQISYFLDNKLLNIIRSNEKIKIERRKYYLIKFSKYAFSLCVLLVFIFFSYFYFFKNYINLYYNKSFITELNGNVFIKNKTGKIEKIQEIPYKIKELDTIITKENSNLKLNIGNNSIIQLSELSEIKIVKLYKKNKIEK